MTSTPPRVLVVEDDAALRDAVTAAMRSEDYEVLGLPDGSEISRRISGFHPDLAISPDASSTC